MTVQSCSHEFLRETVELLQRCSRRDFARVGARYINAACVAPVPLKTPTEDPRLCAAGKDAVLEVPAIPLNIVTSAAHASRVEIVR